MQFRYREMVYRPDYYVFQNDDREEWFINGIFHYNVSRLIKDLAVYEKDASEKPWLFAAVKMDIFVEEFLKKYDLGNLEEEHIRAADLDRPLIFVELAPDSFNLIDGHHRLEKARREGVDKISVWLIGAHSAVHYLGSESEYSKYTEYWNSKIEDAENQQAYCGYFCPCPAPAQERDLIARHIWNRMGMCLNESRRIEVYSEGQWFTLFRLNGKLYCGEAEEHAPSIRCLTPFRITSEMIEKAVEYYTEWYGTEEPGNPVQVRRKELRKNIRHADVLMACVRVFSEY